MTERGLKKINVFIQRLQTFFFYFCHVFTFFSFFSGTFFTSMSATVREYAG